MNPFNKYDWKDLWYTIGAFFNPRQKWLTRVITNKWQDKCELIPLLLFTCLIDFVEGENGLDQLDMDWTSDLEAGYVKQSYVDEHTRRYTLLRDAYLYVKNERPVLHKQMLDAYPEALPAFMGGPVDNTPYAIKYGEVNRLEKLIDEKDQWAMKIIIEQVEILWT